jgi:hypothetical protein
MAETGFAQVIKLPSPGRPSGNPDSSVQGLMMIEFVDNESFNQNGDCQSEFRQMVFSAPRDAA